MEGGRKKKSSTATELICLSTITALQRSEEEARAPRQRLTGSMKPQAVIDKLLAQCESEHMGMLSNSSRFTLNNHHTFTPNGTK